MPEQQQGQKNLRKMNFPIPVYSHQKSEPKELIDIGKMPIPIINQAIAT